MPFSIGPKTIASIVAGLALIGAAIWIYATIENLRTENAQLTAQIAQANAAVAQQAAADNAKAVADQARMAQEKADAVADVRNQLDTANTNIAILKTEADNAPPADTVCTPDGHLPPALIRFVIGLHPGPAATSAGAGNPGAEGSRRSGAVRLPPMAGGKPLVIDIGPPRSGQVAH